MTDLNEATCRCGVTVMESPRSTVEALCIECRRAECGIYWEWFKPFGQWHPTVGYPSPGMGESPDPWAVTREPFPAPVTTSRQGFGMFPTPLAALKLAEFAREHSWEVRTQHSRGNMPHAGNGRPGALKDLIGLRFGAHPMTERQAYAVYSRPASGGTWTWGSVMIWGPTLTPYGGCGITELKAYLMTPDLGDDAVGGWVADLKIAAEIVAQCRAERPKPAAKPREGMS